MTETGRAGFSIRQVTQRTGLSAHTLRFYERVGLFTGPVRRTAGGRRRYTEDDVRWLGYCTRFRASGMPIATIRHFTELVRDGPGTEAARLDILRRHQAAVGDRIDELTACLAVIREKVATYEQSLDRGEAHRLWHGGGTEAGP